MCSLTPDANGIRNIGASNYRWNNVYANNVYQNGNKAWDAGSLPYEVGNWTPRFYFTSDGYLSGTSANTWGHYVKIGQLVQCNFLFTYSGTMPTGTAGANNLVYIADIPITPAHSTNVSIPYYTNPGTGDTVNSVFGTIDPNSDKMLLRYGNAGGFTNVNRGNIAGKSAIRFSGSFCYQTNA